MFVFQAQGDPASDSRVLKDQLDQWIQRLYESGHLPLSLISWSVDTLARTLKLVNITGKSTLIIFTGHFQSN